MDQYRLSEVPSGELSLRQQVLGGYGDHLFQCAHRNRVLPAVRGEDTQLPFAGKSECLLSHQVYHTKTDLSGFRATGIQ
jgi:hypothetical protein